MINLRLQIKRLAYSYYQTSLFTIKLSKSPYLPQKGLFAFLNPDKKSYQMI